MLILSGLGSIVWKKPTHRSASSVNELTFRRAGWGELPVSFGGRCRVITLAPTLSLRSQSFSGLDMRAAMRASRRPAAPPSRTR
jgi:hypothetical protein